MSIVVNMSTGVNDVNVCQLVSMMLMCVNWCYLKLLTVGHLSVSRHHIEFLIGDQVLPYNMTIFQAIKQYALVSYFIIWPIIAVALWSHHECGMLHYATHTHTHTHTHTGRNA